MVQKQKVDHLMSEVEGKEDVLFGSMNIGIKGAKKNAVCRTMTAVGGSFAWTPAWL